MKIRTSCGVLATLACATHVCAQGAAFQTPGMPASAAPPQGGADAGQANRFSNAFNPAFSFVIDADGSWVDAEHGDDGADIELRTLELSANAWVDPNAWAYFIAASDGDTLNVEEAAVHYVGLGGHNTLRAGRFFVDFGKQMQTHAHELRTVERPLPLRAYLGEEVKGDGVQWDDWTDFGDSTAVRWSLGAFANLLPEEGSDFDPFTQASSSVAAPKDVEDFGFTARLTGFTDVGESGTFQLGASMRAIPDYSFSFAPSGATKDGLANYVWGLDATYGWADETGEKRWTLGAEYLLDTGDNGAEVVDTGVPGDPTDDTLRTLDKNVGGYFLFADYAWDRYHSAGVQFAAAELPDSTRSNVNEVEAYYTRMLSEFQRLRFAVTSTDSDVDGRSSAFVVQYTAILGAHGHGVNW